MGVGEAAYAYKVARSNPLPRTFFGDYGQPVGLDTLRGCINVLMEMDDAESEMQVLRGTRAHMSI